MVLVECGLKQTFDRHDTRTRVSAACGLRCAQLVCVDRGAESLTCDRNGSTQMLLTLGMEQLRGARLHAGAHVFNVW